jgi:DNA-directed RNA polymerase subunit beta
VFDNFRLMDSGAQMDFVAERMRGESRVRRITDKATAGRRRQGQAITVAPRVNSRPVAPPASACLKIFLISRVVAKILSSTDTGEEIIQKANELQRVLLESTRRRHQDLQIAVRNELDQGAYHFRKPYAPMKRPTSLPHAGPSP